MIFFVLLDGNTKCSILPATGLEFAERAKALKYPAVQNVVRRETRYWTDNPFRVSVLSYDI